MEIKTLGTGGIKIGIVGSLHGSEIIGKNVIQELIKQGEIKGVQLKTIVANPRAIKLKKRFIDVDGNRCFPGSKNGVLEERIAHNLLISLKECEYVIDIHSTYAKQPDTTIITKPSLLKIARRIPIKKVLMMGPKIAHGHALIDHVKNGISIEFSQGKSTAHCTNIVKRSIANLANKRSPSGAAKEVYDVLCNVGKKGAKIKAANFRRFGKRELMELFHNSAPKGVLYPIFVGEHGYASFSMVAKRRSK